MAIAYGPNANNLSGAKTMTEGRYAHLAGIGGSPSYFTDSCEVNYREADKHWGVHIGGGFIYGRYFTNDATIDLGTAGNSVTKWIGLKMTLDGSDNVSSIEAVYGTDTAGQPPADTATEKYLWCARITTDSTGAKATYTPVVNSMPGETLVISDSSSGTNKAITNSGSWQDVTAGSSFYIPSKAVLRMFGEAEWDDRSSDPYYANLLVREVVSGKSGKAINIVDGYNGYTNAHAEFELGSTPFNAMTLVTPKLQALTIGAGGNASILQWWFSASITLKQPYSTPALGEPKTMA